MAYKCRNGPAAHVTKDFHRQDNPDGHFLWLPSIKYQEYHYKLAQAIIAELPWSMKYKSIHNFQQFWNCDKNVLGEIVPWCASLSSKIQFMVQEMVLQATTLQKINFKLIWNSNPTKSSLSIFTAQLINQFCKKVCNDWAAEMRVVFEGDFAIFLNHICELWGTSCENSGENWLHHIYDLQNCSISSVSAMEMLQSCTNGSYIIPLCLPWWWKEYLYSPLWIKQSLPRDISYTKVSCQKGPICHA